LNRFVTEFMTALVSLGTFGCVTAPPAEVAAKLVPNGVYQHDVAVELHNLDVQHYQGVMRVAAGHVSLAMLTPLGTTLLRITDSTSRNSPEIQVYSADLLPQTARIREGYLDLKPALLNFATKQVELFGHLADVQYENFDEQGVPRTTTVSGTGFHITVTVSHYAPS